METRPGYEDACHDEPGTTGYHKELIAKRYRDMKPGLGRGYGGPDAQELTVIDPVGNKIALGEVEKDA